MWRVGRVVAFVDRNHLVVNVAIALDDAKEKENSSKNHGSRAPGLGKVSRVGGWVLVGLLLDLRFRAVRFFS